MDLHRINTISELKELLSLLREFEVDDFELETEGRKLRVSKGKVTGAPSFAFLPGPPASLPHAPAGAPAAGVGAITGDASTELPIGVALVKSPMVGTFYRAASPEADPFVNPGDRVSDDTTVCIIEAMKVMNEIPSGVSGVVKEILVDNGEAVEFGQPLFHILED